MKKFVKIIKNNTLIKFRLLEVLIIIALVLSFLLARLVPSGKIFYNRDFSRSFFALGGQGFISQFSPAERVDFKSGAYPKLIAEPLYFSLFTPRAFNQARLIVTYQDNLSAATPIIEAGVLKDKVVWQYEMKPVANKILDNLKWPTLQENGLTLYERRTPVADLAYFLRNITLHPDLALYNYSLLRPYYLDSYHPTKIAHVLAPSLRGPYQFYTYIDQEDLNFTFFFQDLNQNYDLKGDGVTILVNDYQGNNILTREVKDDGIIVDTAELSAQSVASFVIKDLPRGVYKVEVKTNDDIITKKILSSQSKISFINKLWLADGLFNKTELYTNVNNLRATAFGAPGQQTLLYAGQGLKINAPFQQFYKRVTPSADNLYSISLSPNNIILENDGLFSFNPSALINPDLKKVDNNWEDDKNINYILADYTPPLVKGDDKVAILNFDLSQAYREKNKYSFMLSIPGLYADNQTRLSKGEPASYLTVKSIRVELVGKSLGTKLQEIWLNKIRPVWPL